MESITPQNAFNILERHILRDGFDLILDFDKSHGSYLHDSRSGQDYLDFFSFFASMPIGFNHPYMKEPEYLKKLLRVASVKPSNSDIYTLEYAEFIEQFHQLAGHPSFHRYFFVAGGALAVENAMKAAFDWKVRKNIAKGVGEKGWQVIHFKQAFHGRSGYTLSLTNTADPRKTMYFPKFNWPRISPPKCIFPMNEANTAQVIESEKSALQEIEQALEQNPDDIAAIVIEPIQSEGGDNHFRKEFLKALRHICDKHEIIYILDEVQTGLGLTGKTWCFEHFDFAPDIVAFGKKAQVCGIASTKRLDEVDSVFKVSSRINSTFGGNLVDMVRCQRYLEIMTEENLLSYVTSLGNSICQELENIANKTGKISNVRGRGLLIAFDCDSTEMRHQLRQKLYEQQVIVLPCGERSIRLRPALNMPESDAFKGLEILEKTLQAYF